MNSDRDGFLLPDSNLNADGLTRGIQGVKNDTASIIKLLKGQTRSTVLQRARPSMNGSGAAGGTRERDSQGRFQRGTQGNSGVEGAVRQMARQQAEQAAINQRSEAARRNREGGNAADGQERDSRGRFGGEGEDDKGGKDGLFSRLKSALSGNADTGDLDKVDPAIEAANELKNLVGGPLKSIGELGMSVIGRGFSGEAKDKAVPWYRKMLQQLKLMRKDDGVFQRTELRRLEEIRNGGGGGGSEGPGFFGTLMGTLFGRIGPMILAGLATVGGALLTGIGTVLGVIFSPIGLAIAAAATLAWGLFTEDGRKFFSALGTKISKAWDTVWPLVVKAGNAANDAVKKATGVDVKANVKASANKAGQVASDISTSAQATGGSLLEKIIPGYRHKATFDGINGGGKLTEYGRYTDAEADKIKQLKGSGANTSANLKGGMPKDVQAKIIAQANAAGLDPAMMLKMAAMESGGNANAISSTGAIGVYQFVGKTASGVGIKDRFDADQNIAGGMALTKENMASLKKSGLPVTAESLYMMHQLGPNAAKEVIRGAASGKNINELSARTQKGISQNYGAGVKTAAGYVGKNGAALSARADIAIGKSATGFLPTALTVAAPASLPPLSIRAPSLPAPAPRADIPSQLNSKGPLEVTVRNNQLANQDVKDRRLAHIATGGVTGG